MNDSVLLTGLPGAGKTRFKQEFALLAPSVSVFELDLANKFSSSLNSLESAKVWCLIDVRSELEDIEAEQVLKRMLAQASGVILSFVDQADLMAQSFWQTWLADNVGSQSCCPRFRWFSTGLPSDWDWQSFGQDQPAKTLIDPPQFFSPMAHYDRVAYVYDYAKGANPTNLEHLLLGLDASKQNLGMQIWRVQGVVKTTEYVNPVAIEGTINRWDTFAGELENESGHLRVEGLNLDKAWLQQIMDASVL